MQPEQLRSGRESALLTQQQAARRLGVSQAYLALLESGRRRITPRLAAKMAKLYRLPATALPLKNEDLGKTWDSASLAGALADLEYPGFLPLRGKPPQNPALILLGALAADDLEVRVVEGLPWLVRRYHDLDWDWLIPEIKQRDLQNRLGFVVGLGRRMAEKDGPQSAVKRLRQVENILDRARLAREDTLCSRSMTNAVRRWLREYRPEDARHWNLLTDLQEAHMHRYAA